MTAMERWGTHQNGDLTVRRRGRKWKLELFQVAFTESTWGDEGETRGSLGILIAEVERWKEPLRLGDAQGPEAVARAPWCA